MNLNRKQKRAYNKLLKIAYKTEEQIETIKYYERILSEQE